MPRTANPSETPRPAAQGTVLRTAQTWMPECALAQELAEEWA